VTARNIRHFMVLAPNLTIYNKLIDDFQQSHLAQVRLPRHRGIRPGRAVRGDG
jgi:hypothetical protein